MSEAWKRIEATLDRTTLLAEKNEKKLDKLEELIVEAGRIAAEATKAVFERDKKGGSLDKLEKLVDETSKAVFETDKKISKMKSDLGGISASNGMLAEDYFYESLKETMTVGGLTFGDRAIDTAKEYGIGVLQLKGDAEEIYYDALTDYSIEIYDENLKIY